RHRGDMPREQVLLEDQVVGREHRDHGLRVTPPDPVRGKKNAGRGASIVGLDQDAWSWTGTELIRDVTAVPPLGYEDRALRGDDHWRACERLAQEGALFEQRDVLLGAIVPADPTGQRAEPDSLLASEDDRPEAHGGAPLGSGPSQGL